MKEILTIVPDIEGKKVANGYRFALSRVAQHGDHGPDGEEMKERGRVGVKAIEDLERDIERERFTLRQSLAIRTVIAVLRDAQETKVWWQETAIDLDAKVESCLANGYRFDDNGTFTFPDGEVWKPKAEIIEIKEASK